MSNVGSRFTRLLSGALLLWLGCESSALAAETATAVNCNTGGSINAALASANTDDPLVITLSGTCVESVLIARGNVTLQGATAADGISAPASAGLTLIAVNGDAHNVTLKSMTLDAGSRTGVFCGSGTSVLVDSVTLNVGSASGVLAIGNSICRVANSTLKGTGGTTSTGLYASTGAYAEIVTSTIDDMYVGVIAQTNATVLVGSFFGSVAIKNNSIGIVLEAGASAQISSAVIENNDLDGIVVNPTGTFTVAGPSTNLTVRNNGGHGISLRKNSSAVIRYATLNIQGNGGYTVNCDTGVGLVLSNIVAANLDGAPNGCN